MFIRAMQQTETQHIVSQAKAARRQAIIGMGASIACFAKSLLALPVMTVYSKAV